MLSRFLALSFWTVWASVFCLGSSAGTLLATAMKRVQKVQRKSSAPSPPLPAGYSLSSSPAVLSADSSVGLRALTAAPKMSMRRDSMAEGDVPTRGWRSMEGRDVILGNEAVDWVYSGCRA